MLRCPNLPPILRIPQACHMQFSCHGCPNPSNLSRRCSAIAVPCTNPHPSNAHTHLLRCACRVVVRISQLHLLPPTCTLHHACPSMQSIFFLSLDLPPISRGLSEAGPAGAIGHFEGEGRLIGNHSVDLRKNIQNNGIVRKHENTHFADCKKVMFTAWVHWRKLCNPFQFNEPVALCQVQGIERSRTTHIDCTRYCFAVSDPATIAASQCSLQRYP